MNTAFGIYLFPESTGLTGNFLTLWQLLCVVKILTVIRVTLTSQLPFCCTQGYFFSRWHFYVRGQGFREPYTFQKLSILALCYCAAVLCRRRAVPTRQAALSVRAQSCTCGGPKAQQSELCRKRYYLVLNLLYLGGKRQAFGQVSLSSDSVSEAQRKVERSGSGLSGAVKRIIWAQRFLTTAGRKRTAYGRERGVAMEHHSLPWVFLSCCSELSRSPLYYSPPGTEKHTR